MITLLHTFAASTVDIASQRIGSSWPWYVVRGSGFVSAGLLVSLMLSGIGQATGITYRFIEPIKAWMLHKALGFSLCASVATHVLFILFDKFVNISIPQVLVPFLSPYNNGTKILGLSPGSLAIALGVLAMYGIILIVLTSLTWIDTKQGVWKFLHYLSYAVMLFVFIHALSTGTDLRYGTFRALWIGLGVVLIIAVIVRAWRLGTLRSKDQ